MEQPMRRGWEVAGVDPTPQKLTAKPGAFPRNSLVLAVKTSEISHHEKCKAALLRKPSSRCQVDSSSEAFQAAALGAFENFYRPAAQ